MGSFLQRLWNPILNMAERGRGRGGRGGQQGNNAGPQRKERAPILDLSKYNDQQIRVKFAGGRQVQGILKGYDQLFNLVLDNVQELDENSDEKMRDLGLVILRGT